MRVRDDRGKGMEVMSRGPRIAGRRSPHDLVLKTYKRVERKGRLAGIVLKTIWSLMAAIFFGVLGIMFFLKPDPLAGLISTLVAVAFLVFLIARPFMLERQIRRGIAHYRALIASTPLCLACGYSLSELTPEPDGCTVCPECGAAWKLGP